MLRLRRNRGRLKKEWADTSVFYGGKNISLSQNLRGVMLLKNGDSLNGYIQFDIKHFPQEHRLNGCWLLPENKNTPIWVNVQKITKIKVEAASFLGRSFTETYTLPINRPKYSFWRLIGKKGVVAIYDRSMGVFSHESGAASRSALPPGETPLSIINLSKDE
jgi:hypothetical protein